MAAWNAGVMRILPAIGCWFRGDAARAERTPRQGRYIACSGPTPEPEFLGRRISNWWLKRRSKNADDKKSGRPMQAACRQKPRNDVSRHTVAEVSYPVQCG